MTIPRPRRAAPSPPLLNPLRGERPLIQGLNLVWVLTLHNFLPRSRREGSKLAWVFIEPVGILLIITVIFTLIGRGSPFGPSLALFLTSGIVPFTFVMQGTQLVSAAVLAQSSPGRLATIGVFHEPLARALFKLFVTMVYFSILIEVIALYESQPIAIHRLDIVALTMIVLFFFIFGWGLVIGFLTHFAPAIGRGYLFAARSMMFISGVFFVPSFLPPEFRIYVSWNPLLHAIELMRAGIFPDYPSLILSPLYLGGFVIGSVALGMSLVWARRVDLLG